MKLSKYNLAGIFGLFLVLFFTNCKKDEGFNLFNLNQDIAFGEQMDSTIQANPSEYPVLNPTQYPEAYSHMFRVRDAILNSGKLNHREDFGWKLTIIHDDDILNAFATPGGYIYFYTGLIKYLDNESEIAGVMAHEIAHADLRHSTVDMTKQYGFSMLLSILLGKNPSQLNSVLADLALGLGGLKFSKEHEYQADEYAVKYTSSTNYDPMGIAGFFIKLKEAGSTSKTPEFLSTHPSEENRIEKITEYWVANGSKTLDASTKELNKSNYDKLKASLP